MGDVIYSIPSIHSMAGGKARLYLQPDVHDPIPAWAGKRQAVRMSGRDVDFLLPLLRAQGLEAEVWKGEVVDYDLDAFRHMGFNLSKFSVARYYSLAYPEAQPRLDLPWLRVKPSQMYQDCILVNLTTRYRAQVSYACLAGRKDVVFVGTGEESKEFTKDCPRIPHAICSDALELAGWIAGCKMLLANQSFCFSLAEGLKSRRCLEVYRDVPNVVPEGEGASYFFNQRGLEYLLK